MRLKVRTREKSVASELATRGDGQLGGTWLCRYGDDRRPVDKQKDR